MNGPLLTLYKYAHNGDWDAIKIYLSHYPNARRAMIKPYGGTALHVAAFSGHLRVEEESVKLMSVEELEIQDNQGNTGLSSAAFVGKRKMAECLVRKNKHFVTFVNAQKKIPLVQACISNCKDMALYLYSVTPFEFLCQGNGHHGSYFLQCAIGAQMLGKRGVPLYLEWTTASILIQSSISKSDEKNDSAAGEQDAKRVVLEQSLEEISEMDIDPDRIESRSLFVKNLNLKTADEILKKHFCVRIKKHMKKGKNLLKSAAVFAHLHFSSLLFRELFWMAMLLFYNFAMPRRMNMQWKDRSSTKLLVRDVAFEAKEKDLRQLFSPFGQVLERAKEGESSEELRARMDSRIQPSCPKRGRTSQTWTKKA
ncbi:hypothetical protein POTOM_000626 [Populus tomentosa]|uniref:Ankyrin repeat family protein n=1 Tax=Populus tomentosa TaxID=118781 RepID=A0A8X8DGF5_POPTO|nr:hypothetical protein POTOM_000626 [Populus tomentosa]